MQFEGTTTLREDAGSLQDLQSAHENLVAWMWALDDLTTQAAPRRGQLETVRWFLGKARRDRRLSLEAIYATIPQLAPAEAEAVRNVQTLTYATMAAGSQHIAKWTLDAVEADWSGYGDETRQLRDMWLQAIEAEKQTLYRLLERGL